MSHKIQMEVLVGIGWNSTVSRASLLLLWLDDEQQPMILVTGLLIIDFQLPYNLDVQFVYVE